jgi:dUTP pyrophosphatase
MIIRFKKLHPWAVAPKQGTPGSAGFDLMAVSREYDADHSVWDYGTGLAVEIPEGFAGMVFPRSSVYRTGDILSNGVGIIDSDYRGEIRAKFYGVNHLFDCPYEVGDRICQLVIVPIPVVEFVEAPELSETARGAGGYGSTGR